MPWWIRPVWMKWNFRGGHCGSHILWPDCPYCGGWQSDAIVGVLVTWDVPGSEAAGRGHLIMFTSSSAPRSVLTSCGLYRCQNSLFLRNPTDFEKQVKLILHKQIHTLAASLVVLPPWGGSKLIKAVKLEDKATITFSVRLCKRYRECDKLAACGYLHLRLRSAEPRIGDPTASIFVRTVISETRWVGALWSGITWEQFLRQENWKTCLEYKAAAFGVLVVSHWLNALVEISISLSFVREKTVNCW